MPPFEGGNLWAEAGGTGRAGRGGEGTFGLKPERASMAGLAHTIRGRTCAVSTRKKGVHRSPAGKGGEGGGGTAVERTGGAFFFGVAQGAVAGGRRRWGRREGAMAPKVPRV